MQYLAHAKSVNFAQFFHSLFAFIAVVVLLFIIYSRQRRRPVSYVVGVDPDDDVRENIINYDEEGVGELDFRIRNSGLFILSKQNKPKVM